MLGNISFRILIGFLFTALILHNCNSNEAKPSIEGQYFYSDYSNLSFYLPTEVEPYNLDDYNQFNPTENSIQNLKLKQMVDNGFIERSINPDAKNFQLFYSDKKDAFTMIAFNELEHIRLNDRLAQNISFGIKRELKYLKSIDSLGEFVQTSVQFINYDNHQKFRNKGFYIAKGDTLFWEMFIVSKHVKTFTVNAMSSNRINFNDYLKEIKVGKVE